MISTQGLTRRFGSFTAVDNVSFEVPSGTICTLLGPNGAGKSTLVKMLTGLMAPSSGEASVAGFDLERDPLSVRRIAGILPEGLGLFDHLTIEEHLLLSGPIYGLSPAETRFRSDQLLSALGLYEARDTFADQSSHGMRKKTSLALALLHNPRVLFLDEPFEGIDPVTANSIAMLLQTISRRGITVFLTSHALSIIDRLADHILVLVQGKLVWQSAAAELPRSLEEHYFTLVEPQKVDQIAWLGSSHS